MRKRIGAAWLIHGRPGGVLLSLAVPVLLLLTGGPARAQTPAPPAPAAGETAAPALHVLLGRTSYEAAAGTAFPLRITLVPGKPPAGTFVTVNVERLAGPEGGHVESVSGVPVTDVICSAPGTYRLQVRVDLVSKGSCGGVEANTLLEREIEVVVHEAPAP